MGLVDHAEVLMGLTDEELHDVLARAQEIDRVARHEDEWTVELAAVIGAAEESGCPVKPFSKRWPNAISSLQARPPPAR